MFDAVLDSLDTHVVVIDSEGFIHYVNKAWVDFGLKNGVRADANWIGVNYLSVCASAANDGDISSLAITSGLRSVIDRKLSAFSYEYPCHSPTEDRWYLFRIAPLYNKLNRFVVSHHNVTPNKLVERQAERLSLEDPLTGLYNRRGLDVFAGEEFARAIRYQTAISIIIIDIDHFKEFNDAYGHHKGDQCLNNIADVIKHYARRPGDIAARIGGDEFVLMLSQTSKEHAMDIANGIKESVHALTMMISNQQRVTISAGITTLIPTPDSDYHYLIYQQADTALYIAKKKRNSVFVVDGTTEY